MECIMQKSRSNESLVVILGVPKLIAALRERHVSASSTVLHIIRVLLRCAVRLGNEFSHNLSLHITHYALERNASMILKSVLANAYFFNSLILTHLKSCT